jgi:hypothetical protein
MKTPNPHLDPFLAALQADLPSAEAETRVRARLLAAGLALTGAAITSGSGAATSLGGAVTALGTATSSGGAGLGAATSGAAGGAAAPVTIAAGAGASGSAGAAGVGAGTAPAALAKLGFLSKLALLPAAAKVGVASTLVVAAAATTVPLLLDTRPPSATTSHSVGTSMPQNPTPARPVETHAPASVAPSRPDPPMPAPVTKTAAPTPLPTGAARRADSQPLARDPAAVPKRERSSSLRIATSTLSEETRLMEAAMLALHEADRELAGRALAEHARRFPKGLLEPERERALARLRQMKTDD